MAEPARKRTVYTIGHSTHEIGYLISLLERHGIDTVADVRSVPYSRHNPQFNRENLADSLRERGIVYVFLGAELGARSEDPGCYEGGRVKYRLLAATGLFREGIESVREACGESSVVLMCAEKNPIDCHRTILVARELLKECLEVMHILPDGRAEPHGAVMKSLLKRLKTGRQRDMFLTEEQLMDEAYAARERHIAYVDKKSVRQAR